MSFDEMKIPVFPFYSEEEAITILLRSKSNYRKNKKILRALGITRAFIFTNSVNKQLSNYCNLIRTELKKTEPQLQELISELYFLLSNVDFEKARMRKIKYVINREKKRKLKDIARKSRVPGLPSLKVQHTARELLDVEKSRTTIGFGVEPVTKIPRVRVEEIVLDNREPHKQVEKSILYAAGWSIDGAFSK